MCQFVGEFQFSSNLFRIATIERFEYRVIVAISGTQYRPLNISVLQPVFQDRQNQRPSLLRSQTTNDSNQRELGILRQTQSLLKMPFAFGLARLPLFGIEVGSEM